MRIDPPTLSKYRSIPSGQVPRSRFATVLGLVVDRLVEAEFVDDVRAFLGATRDADDLLRALDLRDLACGGSGRARSARDDDDVALLDMPDVGQAEIGRHTGDTQNPDGDSRWDTIRKHLHRALCFIGDHIVLPAGHAEHLLTGLVGVRAAFDDLADAAAADDLADLDRRQIAGDVVHPRTNRRVDRQVTDLDQRLAVLQFGQRHRSPVGWCRRLPGQRVVGPGQGVCSARSRGDRKSAAALGWPCFTAIRNSVTMVL